MDYSKYASYAKQKLGYSFNDLELLVTAFTHRSYLNEHKKTAKEHNERMEFLGDAVLELAVTKFLYNHYDESEGILTNWRSSLVRTETISEAGKQAAFEPLLRLSRGERKGGDRARMQILANTYEAVVGAIYLDQGFAVADKFIHETLLIKFDHILKTGAWIDPKSQLQEVAQSKTGNTPVYKVLDEDGPDHEKTFTVGVFVGGEIVGKGQGPSKQAGQVAAAEKALTKYED